jgi:4-hydroxy-tetrahydrodipicolinate synthase
MSAAEHRRVVEITVEETRGRVPVIAGAGSNDTHKAIALSADMRAAGATHLLHVSPSYNKPPQRGIIAHFRAIAESTDLPIIVYNVPGRTGSNIEARTTLALAEIPGVVAIKEASGNLGQIMEIIRNRPAHFSVLSGDDALTLAVMAAGGDGIVSVISNATPRAMSRLVECCRDGDFAGARAINDQLAAWMRAAFIESNPMPAKAALAMMGRMKNVLRLPLVPLRDDLAPEVRQALMAAGALS